MATSTSTGKVTSTTAATELQQRLRIPQHHRLSRRKQSLPAHRTAVACWKLEERRVLLHHQRRRRSQRLGFNQRQPIVEVTMKVKGDLSEQALSLIFKETQLHLDSNSVKKHVLNCQSMNPLGAKISKQAWMTPWVM